VVKTHQKVQLCSQQLPAKSKNNKKAQDLSAFIVDWADLNEEQRKEVVNWGPDAPDAEEDYIEVDDPDTAMSGPPEGGSEGGAPGGSGGGGGAVPLPPAVPPTLADLTHLVNNIRISLRQLAMHVTLMATRPGG
jgi:hypothetical protein